MPLLLTPAAPLRTTALLEVPRVYVIVDDYGFTRKLRQAHFRLGYYVHEAASLAGSGAAQVEVNLPLDFVLNMTPEDANRVGGDPREMLEIYAAHELLALLPDATIETVE